MPVRTYKKRTSQTATELPSNENYEDLPALPKHIDTWLSDVVSPVRQPEVYEQMVAYTLDLMVEWGEDGTRTFEAYAPYVVGFIQGRMKAAPAVIPTATLPSPLQEPPTPAPKPRAHQIYKTPRISSLLPED